MNDNDLLLVLCTAPSHELATSISECLVREGLAACVNQLSGIDSIYMWECKHERSSEVLMMIKTTRARYQTLEARIAELHEYDTPEILGIEVSEVSRKYSEWVSAQTKEK